MARTICLIASLLTLLIGSQAGAHAAAVPEPQPVPVRWEFEFRPDALRLVRLGGENEAPSWYAFMTYRVTNTSGQDRMLAPLLELSTDKGHVVRSGRGVRPEITQTIMGMLDDPLLLDQLSIVRTLLQGTENTRRGLAVWRLPDVTADEIKVFAAGFSGESEAFFITDPDTGERVRKVLRKTRMLRYDMPGVVTDKSSPTPDLLESRWILR